MLSATVDRSPVAWSNVPPPIGLSIGPADPPMEGPPMVMPYADLMRLLHYQTSIPTGTTIGKMWRKCVPYGPAESRLKVWFIQRYDYYDENNVTISTFEWRPPEGEAMPDQVGGGFLKPPYAGL